MVNQSQGSRLVFLPYSPTMITGWGIIRVQLDLCLGSLQSYGCWADQVRLTQDRAMKREAEFPQSTNSNLSTFIRPLQLIVRRICNIEPRSLLCRPRSKKDIAGACFAAFQQRTCAPYAMAAMVAMALVTPLQALLTGSREVE